MVIEAARDRMRELDDQIVALAAERTVLARRIGHAKADAGRPIVDFTQERRVLDRARAAATEHGLEPEVAEAIALRLIEAAVTAQEDERLRTTGTGAGRRAAVVGGAGRMGRWCVGFLAAQGWDVTVIDPQDPESPGIDAADAADMVLVAVPTDAIPAMYAHWIERPPSGIVCDVASIKTPILDAIAGLRAAGARVASLHPLFGPSARVLRGVDVIVCDLGDTPADQEARDTVAALFDATTARQVHVPLAEHDAWMADVLGLAHATVLAFAAALPESPLPVRSTTLGRLGDIAWDATHESPDVYYDVQAANPHAPASLRRLRDAVDGLLGIVEGHDRAGFHAYMDTGRHRVAGLREVPA